MLQIVAVVIRHGQNPRVIRRPLDNPGICLGSNADILKVDDRKRQLRKEMRFLETNRSFSGLPQS